MIATALLAPSLLAPRVPRRAQIPVASASEQRVAIVTGASRGIGRGIAIELGRAGFAVHCVGRSSRSGGQTTERAVADTAGELTVEATAEAVSAAGGRGVAVQADLSAPPADAVEAALVERVASAEGRLDVVVCSAYTTPPDLNDAKFRDDFWKQGATMWDAVHGVGLRSVFMTCCAAAPPMIETAAVTGTTPLVVLVSSFAGKAYTFNVPYGVGKAAVDRLGSDMALQLKSKGVATTVLYPGVVRTEGNLEMDARGDWAAASGGLDLGPPFGETPAFTGRALTALLELGGEALLERSGDVQVVAELARDLDFADVDGNRPPSIRSLAFLFPQFIFPQIEAESGQTVPNWIKEAVPDVLLPWSIFTSGPPPTANQD